MLSYQDGAWVKAIGILNLQGEVLEGYATMKELDDLSVRNCDSDLL